MKELGLLGQVIIKKPEKTIIDTSKKYRPINTPEKGRPGFQNEKGGFIKPPRPKSWDR